MIFQDRQIISGGQTGVDRAALDFALKYQIPCGGCCPKGRLAEDGTISPEYPLIETVSSDYSERTEKNVVNSDGTLLITVNQYSDQGTTLTSHLCDQHSKPYLMIDLNKPHLLLIEQIHAWMIQSGIKILNIAGPRESSSPGIYNRTMELLEETLRD